MNATTGPVLACAALLVLAGAPKLARPAMTVTALRSVGVSRAGASTVRVLAALEVLIGAAVLVRGGRWPDAAAATAYAGFCLFLVLALRRPAASCGCAGHREAPPTVAHLVMNVAFAACAAVAAATDGSPGVVDLARAGGPLHVAVVIGYAALATWLGWVVLTVLPRLQPVRSA